MVPAGAPYFSSCGRYATSQMLLWIAWITCFGLQLSTSVRVAHQCNRGGSDGPYQNLAPRRSRRRYEVRFGSMRPGQIRRGSHSTVRRVSGWKCNFAEQEQGYPLSPETQACPIGLSATLSTVVEAAGLRCSDLCENPKHRSSLSPRW